LASLSAGVIFAHGFSGASACSAAAARAAASLASLVLTTGLALPNPPYFGGAAAAAAYSAPVEEAPA
jgi:hypothetical protein